MEEIYQTKFPTSLIQGYLCLFFPPKLGCEWPWINVKQQRKGNQIMGKPKILCIHAFRISAKIFLQMLTTYWSPEILDRLDLHFVDAPYPAQGPSAVKNLPQFPPPYYEWFQSTEVIFSTLLFQYTHSYILKLILDKWNILLANNNFCF